jgi:hypothetical protein
MLYASADYALRRQIRRSADRGFAQLRESAAVADRRGRGCRLAQLPKLTDDGRRRLVSHVICPSARS